MVSAQTYLNLDTSQIRLSNPRSNKSIKNPIDSSRSFHGTIWDSPFGEIHAGTDLENPDKAIIVIWHKDIPSHILVGAAPIHHWGFSGVYELDADSIMMDGGLFTKKEKFNTHAISIYVKDLICDWKNMFRHSGPIKDVPLHVDGEQTEYSETVPNPAFVIENLPIEHHTLSAAQDFHYTPQALFIHKELVEISLWGNDKSTMIETTECLRVDMQAQSWFKDSDGNWHQTGAGVPVRYAAREFIEGACAMHQRIVERERIIANQKPDLRDTNLGRTFI